MSNFSCKNGHLSGAEGAKTVVGHYAVSLAGHDSGKIYFVVGASSEAKKEGLLLLSDGKSRPLGRPKAKKSKHVRVLRERDEELASLLASGRGADDSVLIRKLREFGKSRNCD